MLLGGSRRAFVEDGASAGVVPVPFVGAELAADVPIVASLTLQPWVDALYDLRPVEIQTPTRTVTISGAELRAGVSLAWHL